MKFTVAFILVAIAMASADIPRHRVEIVKRSPGYVARGWAPSGQQLNLPVKQQQPLPTPAASYGPPPEVPTTEQPSTTTENSTAAANATKAENLELEPEQNTENVEQPQGQYYVVLPQEQNFVYTIPRAALVTVPKGELLAATPARLQAVPLTAAVASSVYTPYSSSSILIYQ